MSKGNSMLWCVDSFCHTLMGSIGNDVQDIVALARKSNIKIRMESIHEGVC